VFVTPEYNHSTPGALKNAIDFLYREWNNKAAGFVGYGVIGAARAVEHLRLIAAAGRSHHGYCRPERTEVMRWALKPSQCMRPT
jgi:NAD(P)H-dependent FMN reductase